MRLKLKAALVTALATTIGGVSLLASATPAFAAGAVPTWEPDGNAALPYGNIQLFDANGVVVTGGLTNVQPFAWAVATTGENATAGGIKATAFFRDPSSSKPPSGWGGPQESANTTFSPATSLPAGVPATVAADAAVGANETPVVQMNPAGGTTNDNIDYWASHNSADSNANYDNIIDMIIQTSGGSGGDVGGSTYWNTDIGFCPTSAAAACTAAGVTIQPGHWEQLFPLQTTPAAPTLSATLTGNQAVGSSETLNVSGAPTSPAGDIVFEDNGIAINTAAVSGTGTASYGPFSPIKGTHTYQAYFVPTPPSESTPDSATATQVTSSASGTQSESVANSTTVALTDNATNNTAAYGSSVTFSATVGETDGQTTGEAGNVMFYDGNPASGGTALTTSPGVGTTSANTTATFSTSTLTQGTHNIYAVYTPTDTTDYNSSQASIGITISAPAQCSSTRGSNCTDTQNLSVVVSPGAITISTPYNGPGNGGAFTLPQMTLSSDGTYLASTATFPPSTNPANQQIVVTSTLDPAYAWTLAVSATPLSDGSGDTIPAAGLGLTTGTGQGLLNPAPGASSYPGTVTFHQLPGHNPSAVNSDPNTSSAGLSGTGQTWANSNAADGTAVMDGQLTLYASTATPPGTYVGTITFTVS